MNPDLERLFRKDSSVLMGSGRKGSGKTDFALKLGEDAFEADLIRHMGTNIKTIDERIDHVTNYPHLKEWMHKKGSKYFLLDEAGKVLKRMRFMSALNLLILDIVQLARHYDCKFCAVAPSEKFIDSNYLNTDILDCKWRKLGREDFNLELCSVKNYVTYESYTLNDVERTGIQFDSKDVATFTLEAPVDMSKFSKIERCAFEYGRRKSMDAIGQGFDPPLHRQMVARNVQRYLMLHFKELSSRHKSLT